MKLRRPGIRPGWLVPHHQPATLFGFYSMPMKPKSHMQRMRDARRCQVDPREKNRARLAYDRRYEEKRKQSPELLQAQKIRSGKAWKDCRRAYLNSWPLCYDPFNRHKNIKQTIAAREVHHIEGLARRPDLAYDWNNLAGLCKKCHAGIEGLERLGKATARYFKERRANRQPEIF